MGITKISIALLSILVLVSSGLASNQAFAGVLQTCDDCEVDFDDCIALPLPFSLCEQIRLDCRAQLQCDAVGGEFIGIETTSVLAAGAQYTAAWMIPVIVSAIGIGIVIARKF